MSHNINLLDNFDRLISQAKEYITEKNKKNTIVKAIEMEAAEIQSDLISKRDEIKKLVSELDNNEADLGLKHRLDQSIKELDFIEQNVLILAEKKWMMDYLRKESEKYHIEQSPEREKYITQEVRRIKEELIEIDSFYKISEFVNQVWADLEIFQEFSKLEEILKLIIHRMNVTNQKGSETHLSKDPVRTLEHIRLNLFKSSTWSDEEIAIYQKTRNREIRQYRHFTVNGKKKLIFYIIGGPEELCTFLSNQYHIPDNLEMNWIDICLIKDLSEIRNANQVILVTYFPQNELFGNLITNLQSSKINYTLLENYTPGLIFKAIEDSFAKFNLKNLFS